MASPLQTHLISSSLHPFSSTSRVRVLSLLAPSYMDFYPMYHVHLVLSYGNEIRFGVVDSSDHDMN